MSARRTKPASKTAESPTRGYADLARMRAMTEEEIMATSPPELADLPPNFYDEAVLVLPGPTQPISLRVNEKVLEWFKSLGPRYQTRMNVVLWSYMERMKKRKVRIRRVGETTSRRKAR